MAVTPLVSTRSGIRSANFGGPFTRIEDTADIFGPGQGMFTPFVGADTRPFVIQRDPYPWIRWGTTLDAVSGDHGYAFQALQNTTEFGVYYPDKNQFGTATGSLNFDATEITVKYDSASSIATDDYNSITVDPTTFALGPNPVPMDGSVTRPISGTIADVVGWGFDYNYAEGCAEWFNVVAAPYYSNGRYLIFFGGSKMNAWTVPEEYAAIDPTSNAGNQINVCGTMNDEVHNYTLQHFLGGGVSNVPCFLTKWQGATYNVNGPFTCESFSISLSNTDDDAIWQDYFGTGNTKQYLISHNTAQWIFVAYNANNISANTINARPTATVFIFNMDMTSYERVDVTFASSLNWATYFMDVDGLEYAIGSNSSDGVIIYQVGTSAITGAVSTKSWGFSLDGHDFYVLPSIGLVYDLTTGQWSEWINNGLTRFRPCCGQNWQGMATSLSDGGTDIVGGDDTTGVLWRLDPTKGRDDLTTTGDESFVRIVTGGIALNGRDAVACNAVELTLALGNPSQSGASLVLQTSDDLGTTWVNHGTVTADASNSVVEWRSLGTMTAPGRIFRISDDGATVRIGRADIR